MRYRVRAPEGELTYESFREVAHAYATGLVGPDDEVSEEGKDRWRKACTIPELIAARRQSDSAGSKTQWLMILSFVVFGSITLYLLLHGRWLLGIAIAIALGSILTSVTYRAYKRARPTHL